jgi:uncharacterized protein YlxW (UPF0749 family)
MSLLVDMMSNTLDEAYADHARARADARSPAPAATARTRVGRIGGAAVLVLLGLLTGTAVDQVRERAQAADGLRAGLAVEVEERSAVTDQLSAEAAELRAEVAATRDAALQADAAGQLAAERVQALELASATTAVAGPGIVLTLADATEEQAAEAAPELRGGTPLDGRVIDRDLQDVVNGLWAAGAEAVAVDGVRLSSRAAIRSAGEAILVDFKPLTPPYEVRAVGRPADLEVGFLDGPSGRRLQTLSSFSGITYDLRRAEELRLPAATEPELRAAIPAGEPR